MIAIVVFFIVIFSYHIFKSKKVVDKEDATGATYLLAIATLSLAYTFFLYSFMVFLTGGYYLIFESKAVPVKETFLLEEIAEDNFYAIKHKGFYYVGIEDTSGGTYIQKEKVNDSIFNEKEPQTLSVSSVRIPTTKWSVFLSLENLRIIGKTKVQLELKNKDEIFLSESNEDLNEIKRKMKKGLSLEEEDIKKRKN